MVKMYTACSRVSSIYLPSIVNMPLTAMQWLGSAFPATLSHCQSRTYPQRNSFPARKFPASSLIAKPLPMQNLSQPHS